MRRSARWRATWAALLLGLVAMVATAQGEVVRIDRAMAVRLDDSKASAVPAWIDVGGRRLGLQLEDNVGLLEGLPASRRQALRQRGDRFLAGKLTGNDTSWVRLSRVAGRWSGAWFDGRELLLLESRDAIAKALPLAAPSGDLLAFRLADAQLSGIDDGGLITPGSKPATAPTRLDYQAFRRHLAETAALSAKGAVRQLSLTVVTDTEFSTVHGALRDSVVASRVNLVDGIYTDQFDTRIALGELRHLTDNSILNTTVVSGSDSLLGRFTEFMDTGAGSAIPKGGLSHLFSGKDFDGSTAGVAWVGTLCSIRFGFAINQVRNTQTSTALIIAHEMGHNFGASHDGQTGSNCATQEGAWLMSPSINGSTQFSPCSRTFIEPRIAAASCLAAVGGGATFFADGFESR